MKIEQMQKLEKIKEESYGQKAYLTELQLNDARLLFRIRTKNINCKMNQSSSHSNKASLWKCDGCGYIDTQSHILYCPSYQHLREGKSMDSDKDLVAYFRDVLKEREDD